ncbi:eukaryotic aspartyl protease [Hirsutella rhossiliensis]|uniref:Probable aspartic-type endopeptidase OPSB n=1 Tax=Hirsutella rhossiliensis TaxID=111463 RepID=A0A9P8SJC9_9HYPO|nr:eukaryotic aspartyl protease domain-containing protein [Hirsutella rhossiliensis]KAH0963575.1 eukaryotic aspartyl protease domain-containing protein [Hirsutella rhossiliensis]
MKSTTLLLALGTIIPTPAAGLSPGKRQDGSPRVLGLNLRRQVVRDPIANDAKRLRKRAGSVNATMDNHEILYFLNGTLGNPPQPVRMHLDTGSSDLWINTAKSDLCSLKSRPCAASGTYNANSSSSYNYIGSFFNISYVDGSGASGDYVTDTLRLFGQEIQNFQFGVGYTSTSPQAVLGVGYPANEAPIARFKKTQYDNLPAKMAKDSIIASSAYSLWLNDIDAQDGTILFGGIDKARFKGQLVSLPIQKVDDQFVEFYITLTGLSVGGTTAGDNMALAVLLDSGSSFTYLPNNLIQPIYKALNAQFEQGDGVAYVPCSLRNQDTNLTFRFSDPAVIDVPLREVVIDPTELPSGRPMAFGDGTPACYCGILPSDNSISVLGDTFLRSAYVVYDMGNNKISLAKTNFNATGSDIAEIGTGANAVPQAVAAQKPVAATSGIPDRSSRNGNSNKNGAAGVPAPSLAPVALTLALSLLVGFAGFVS